jgi:hypothetical protein
VCAYFDDLTGVFKAVVRALIPFTDSKFAANGGVWATGYGMSYEPELEESNDIMFACFCSDMCRQNIFGHDCGEDGREDGSRLSCASTS